MIAIVNNGGHNISSVKFALERLGYRSVITSKIVEIQKQGKKIQKLKEFLLGNPIKNGSILN